MLFVTINFFKKLTLMEKIELSQKFATRLHDSLIAAGHGSSRSATGVNIDALVNLSGHSAQICRKYLRGQAIPEPLKLAEISAKLNVSPGWLLFGDSPLENKNKNISLSKDLLHYIFMSSAELYNNNHDKMDIADFLIELVQDISQTDANEEQLKKIIDLSLSSIRHFK